MITFPKAAKHRIQINIHPVILRNDKAESFSVAKSRKPALFHFPLSTFYQLSAVILLTASGQQFVNSVLYCLIIIACFRQQSFTFFTAAPFTTNDFLRQCV